MKDTYAPSQAKAAVVALPLEKQGQSRWVWPLQGLAIALGTLITLPLLRFFL